MSSGDSPGEYDPLFEPLALAVGHLVVATALLERTLLALLVQLEVDRDGASEVFGSQLVSRLERLPAGALLESMRRLGFEKALAAEIASVIDDRNRFVHRLFDEPELITALATRASIDGLAARIEAATQNTYRVIKKLEPITIAGAERALGKSATELVVLLREIDTEEIDEAELRDQIKALQQFPDDMIAP